MRTIIAAAVVMLALAGPAGADSTMPPNCNETWIGALISPSAMKPGPPALRTFFYFRRADIAAVRWGGNAVTVHFKPGTINPDAQYIHGGNYTIPFLRCLLGESQPSR